MSIVIAADTAEPVVVPPTTTESEVSHGDSAAVS
jgi:hypothetical protein